MAITKSFSGSGNAIQNYVDGFTWAWKNGADVISCSWAIPSFTTTGNQYIEDAIDSCVIRGRGGKGAVVVFGSGNGDDSVVYFPSSLPTTISVGAVSPCGERCSPASCDTEIGWGSNYGTNLDIMAPGVLISTLDMQGNKGYNPDIPIHPDSLYDNYGTILGYEDEYTDLDYTIWFGRTSSACPQVAAVACLVISANPNLTGQEVRDIIESTAQKVRPDLYSYDTVSGRDNGTWCESTGYGLLDAYAAVYKAKYGIFPPPEAPVNDLMIADCTDDDGTPNSCSGVIFNSPSIWLRNQDDGFTVQENQNAIKDSTRYVYVRIKNIGNQDYNGDYDKAKLYVYWAKSGATSPTGVDLAWDYCWTGNRFSGNGPLMGNLVYSGYRNILYVPAGDEIIMEVPWNNYHYSFDPSDYNFTARPWEFYLLARIVYDDDPMAFFEGEDVFLNTKQNNNIAIRGIHFEDNRIISGDADLQTCKIYTYTYDIENPNLYTFEWSYNTNVLGTVSQSGNVLKIKPVCDGTDTIRVNVYADGRLMYSESKVVTVNGSAYSSLVSLGTHPINLKSNATWSNDNHLLTVPIIIEYGATLTITGNVYCEGGATFMVMPGGKLVVNGGTLTETCNNMWTGIELWGNNGLPQFPANQGFVELKNNAVIRNAVIGVYASTPVYMPSFSGGILQATDAHFINNQQAVYFGEYIGYENGNMHNNKSYFKRCKFICEAYVFGGVQVELQGVRGVLFENCEFTNKQWDGAETCIYANKSGIRVGSSPSANGCKFSGFDKGIYIKDAEIYPSFIYSSDFQSNAMGIVLEGAKSVDVKSCNFYKTGTGIYVKQSFLYTIENNIFSSDGGSMGITVENTGSMNHFIRNNTFKNLCTSCLAIGDNGNGTDCEQFEGVVFQCNTYDREQAIVVAQNSRIRFIQSGKTTVAATGNEFTGTSYPSISNAGTDAFNYQYLFPSPNDFHTPRFYLCSSPFIYTIPKEKDNCGGLYGCVGNTYYLGPWEKEENMEDDYSLVQSIKGNKPKPNNINWDDHDVIDIVGQLTMEDGDDFTVTINGLPPSHPLEEQVVLYYEHTNLKQAMDMLCYNALDIILNDENGLDIEEYRTWLERFNTVETEYLLAESRMATGDFAIARTILSGIPAKFQCAEAFVSPDYLAYVDLAEAYYNLDDGDIITPVWVSEAVRLSFGSDYRAALKAYSLAEIAVDGWKEMYPRDFEIHPSCNCNPDEDDDSRGGISDSSSVNFKKSKSSKHRKSMEEEDFEESINNGIQIYPNPTTGELQITIEESKIEKIDVFDIVGRKLLTFQLSTFNSQINISHLSPGMYFLRIKTENSKTTMKKVVRE